MPSFIDIVNEMKTILAGAAAINAWCQTNYSVNVTAYKGVTNDFGSKLAYPHICLVDMPDQPVMPAVVSGAGSENHLVGVLLRVRHPNNTDERFDRIIQFKEVVKPVLESNYSLNGKADLVTYMGSSSNANYPIGNDVAQRLITYKVAHSTA